MILRKNTQDHRGSPTGQWSLPHSESCLSPCQSGISDTPWLGINPGVKGQYEGFSVLYRLTTYNGGATDDEKDDDPRGGGHSGPVGLFGDGTEDRSNTTSP